MKVLVFNYWKNWIVIPMSLFHLYHLTGWPQITTQNSETGQLMRSATPAPQTSYCEVLSSMTNPLTETTWEQMPHHKDLTWGDPWYHCRLGDEGSLQRRTSGYKWMKNRWTRGSRIQFLNTLSIINANLKLKTSRKVCSAKCSIPRNCPLTS